MERRKYLGRYDKDFIKSIDSRTIRVDDNDIVGYAALVRVIEVKEPYMVGVKGSEICIADNGYSELAFLPDNENWQMTAIYDNNNYIVEWYFDITRLNSVDEKGNPYCDDIYLDAALMPDGKLLIFDEDELKKAFDNGKITQKEHDNAFTVLHRLKEKNILTIAYVEALCSRLHLLFDSVEQGKKETRA
jgi:predicted RNA-binding protein associated with RNAse of E/G family